MVSPPTAGASRMWRIEPSGGVWRKVTSVCHHEARSSRPSMGRTSGLPSSDGITGWAGRHLAELPGEVGLDVGARGPGRGRTAPGARPSAARTSATTASPSGRLRSRPCTSAPMTGEIALMSSPVVSAMASIVPQAPHCHNPCRPTAAPGRVQGPGGPGGSPAPAPHIVWRATGCRTGGSRAARSRWRTARGRATMAGSGTAALRRSWRRFRRRPAGVQAVALVLVIAVVGGAVYGITASSSSKATGSESAGAARRRQRPAAARGRQRAGARQAQRRGRGRGVDEHAGG